MKVTVMKPVEIDVHQVEVSLPVRYGTEDIPNDFPFRDGDTWKATIMVGSGQILGWPEGREALLYMKVADEGSYRLLSPENEVVGSIEQNYVPHGLIPGEYGDYVGFDICGDGVISNWPSDPDLSEFFKGDAED